MHASLVNGIVMEVQPSVPATATKEAPVFAAPPAIARGVWPLPIQIAVAALLMSAFAFLACKCLVQSLEAGSGTIPAQKVDLNTATHAELLLLPGVGENLAERIAVARGQGQFTSVDDLRKVKGIGPATLERLRSWVYVSANPAPADAQPSLPITVEPSKRPGAKAKKAANLDAPIDINTASAGQLRQIPGIGPKLSQRIVAARTERPFANVAELRRVHGIGPKTLEKMRPYVTVVSNASEPRP